MSKIVLKAESYLHFIRVNQYKDADRKVAKWRSV